MPPLVLEGSTEVRVRFIDVAMIELLSRCTLDGRPPPPCESPERETRWKLYAVPLHGGELSSRRADLPAGVAADPRRVRFGWVAREQVCVGDPNDVKPRCTPIPEALRRTR